jgi:hypothetical protein
LLYTFPRLGRSRWHNIGIQLCTYRNIITVSSAYKSTKSFKYTSSSISKSSVIDVRPLTFLSFKNCFKANLKFTYNNRDLEIVPNCSYLGITFSKSGSFNAAKKDLVNKGTKAMYEVLKKGRLHNLKFLTDFLK